MCGLTLCELCLVSNYIDVVGTSEDLSSEDRLLSLLYHHYKTTKLTLCGAKNSHLMSSSIAYDLISSCLITQGSAWYKHIISGQVIHLFINAEA